MFRVFLGLIASATMTVSAQAAVLTVDGSGQLTGATGVDVGGTLYDVVFSGESCVSNFDGCDATTDFMFDQTTAQIAAQALIDQVFLDATTGNFDSVPGLTNGCTSPSTCNALIPYDLLSLSNTGLIALAVTAINQSGALADTVGSSQASISAVLASQSTFAIFSLADVNEVPIPGALPLFLAGLAGLRLVRKNRRA